jgi:hypothetical protein
MTTNTSKGQHQTNGPCKALWLSWLPKMRLQIMKGNCWHQGTTCSQAREQREPNQMPAMLVRTSQATTGNKTLTQVCSLQKKIFRNAIQVMRLRMPAWAWTACLSMCRLCQTFWGWHYVPTPTAALAILVLLATYIIKRYTWQKWFHHWCWFCSESHPLPKETVWHKGLWPGHDMGIGDHGGSHIGKVAIAKNHQGQDSSAKAKEIIHGPGLV